MVGLSVVLSGLWVVGNGYRAARDLQGLERTLNSLRTEAVRTTPAIRLDALTAEAQAQAQRANRHTHDVVWGAWSHAPFVGSTLRTTMVLSHESALLTTNALPSFIGTAKSVPHLRSPRGTVDITPLRGQQAGLRVAAQTLTTSVERVSALAPCRVSQVERGRTRFIALLGELAGRARGLAVAAAVGPDVMGFEGDRRYLVTVQNNAEARASGGIVGAYGLLSVRNGKPVLETFGPDTELRGVPRNAIDLGDEWRRRYDLLGSARDWREVTATPDFPTAGKMMLALWATTHGGQQLDGVLSIDPPGLADILEATGPLPSTTGGPLTYQNVVARTLSDAYRLFPDKAKRSEVLSDDAEATFKALTAGAGDSLVLGERMGHAVLGGHLKLYLTRTELQNQLETTAVASALPATASPYLSVITQDGNNDKLSYYLRRDVGYRGSILASQLDFGSGKGPEPQEAGVVTVRLHNTAPASGLPDYVAPATNLATGKAIPRGRMRVSVSIYLGRYGLLESAALDGKPIDITSETEQGMAVLTTAVDIDPGGTVTLVFNVVQPTQIGHSLLVLQQPLVVADNLLVSRRDVLDPPSLN